MKVSSRNVLDILRRYEIANSDNVPRNVESVKISHPKPINTLVSFIFLSSIAGSPFIFVLLQKFACKRKEMKYPTDGAFASVTFPSGVFLNSSIIFSGFGFFRSRKFMRPLRMSLSFNIFFGLVEKVWR